MRVAANNTPRFAATELKDEKRFSHRSLIVVLFAALLLLLGFGFKAYRFTLPTEGWSLQLDFEKGLIFDQNLLGVSSLLQQGDILLNVAGESMDSNDPFALPNPEAQAAYRMGNTVQYQVQREGETLSFDVPLYHWTPLGIAKAFWQVVLNRVSQFSPFVVLQLAIALFVFIKRPNNLAAQLLLLSNVGSVVSGVNWVSAIVSPGDTLDPLARVTSYLFGMAINPALLVPLFLHLALIFPKPKWGFQKSVWPVTLLYGLPLILYSLRDFHIIPNLPADVFVPVYFLISIVAFIYSLVTIKDKEQRAQIKWVVYGGAIQAFGSLLWVSSAILQWLPWSTINYLQWIPWDFIFPLCFAIAILKYRLFDIDLIINRTLVYGTLSLGVVGLYLGLVTGSSYLLQTQANLGVSLVATGFIAVIFNPLRSRLQRFVNRLLYGDRDDPYKVLSSLSGRMQGILEPSKLLPTMTETIATTLKLPYTAIALGQNNNMQIVASHGTSKNENVILPLAYQGETVGELRLEPRAGETFKGTELNLLKTIAQQASVAAYTVKQNLDLQHSREALVTAREEERLRIRRDLHDGLGPELASLTLKLDATRNVLKRDTDKAETLLVELKHQTQDAIASIRRLVYALRPPALDELGLEGALREQVRGYEHTLNIELKTVGDLTNLPAATEVACYRIAQEALTNVVRHSRAKHCKIILCAAEQLFIDVQDDGIGLPEQYRAGVGLRSMRERAEELGGTFIMTSLDKGTRLLATLPLPIESRREAKE
jgi:signal transduction histidine kinase